MDARHWAELLVGWTSEAMQIDRITLFASELKLYPMCVCGEKPLQREA